MDRFPILASLMIVLNLNNNLTLLIGFYETPQDNLWRTLCQPQHTASAPYMLFDYHSFIIIISFTPGPGVLTDSRVPMIPNPRP